MAEVWLLCEGDSDRPVLDAVLTRVLAAGIVVKAAGGVSNAPSAVEYVKRHHPEVTAGCVIDRDYNQRDVADASFTDGKHRFMWRRHGIESYLLAPAVIAQALRAIKATVAATPGGGAPWVTRLPDDEAVIAQGLRECAGKRVPEEAMRVAVHRLWEDLSDTAGRVQKRVPSIPGPHLDGPTCRQAMLSEAARIATKAAEAAACPHLVPAAVGARYDAELARLSDATYLAEMRFLEELNGKDLLSALGGWLQAEHGARLSRKLLTDELVKAVPVVYRANRSIYGTDDFLDLANGVRALAGLPAIS